MAASAVPSVGQLPAWMRKLAPELPAGLAGGRSTGVQAPVASEVGLLQVEVGPAHKRRLLPVHYALPDRPAADAAVLVVLHGIERNARQYLDLWRDLALHRGYLVVAPEFSVPPFHRTRGYQMGNLFRRDGGRRPPQESAFAALEQVFDTLRERFGLAATEYALFGHSAGAQFVHRMVLFWPRVRYRLAVAANAGTYTCLDPAVPLRFGIADAGLDRADLVRALAAPLVVMAGARDTDTRHPALNRSPPALAQGRHRLARAAYFMAQARRMARQLETPVAWRYQEVPGAGHEPAAMAAAAAGLLDT